MSFRTHLLSAWLGCVFLLAACSLSVDRDSYGPADSGSVRDDVATFDAGRDASESDAAESDAAGRDASESDAAESDAAESDATESDARPSCSDGIQNGDEIGIDCGGACAACDSCTEDSNCATHYCDESGHCAYPTTCKDIPDFIGEATLNHSDGPLEATCDAGWTLVLNYLHGSDTLPETRVLRDRLPLIGSNDLNQDESESLRTWGHASAAMLSSLPFTETRWYGESGEHERILHFTSSSSSFHAYLRGSQPDGNIDSFSELSDHTAELPEASMIVGQTGDPDDRMTTAPFYSPEFQWLIGASRESKGEPQWAMDDEPGFHATLHRVWIR